VTQLPNGRMMLSWRGGWPRRRTLPLIVGASFAMLTLATRWQERPPLIRGFTAASAARERALEAELSRRVSRDSVGAFFKYLTAEPHPAGSVRNKTLADFVAARFRQYGLEDVRTHRYDVLLPWPREVKVEMTAPTRYVATLKEDAVTASGKHELATWRWTVIFEKQAGKWMIVHEHVSAPLQ